MLILLTNIGGSVGVSYSGFMIRPLASKIKGKVKRTYNRISLTRISRLSYEAGVSMERQDWPEAVKKWQTIVDNYGKKAPSSAWIGLSTSLRKQGRFERANKVIREAIKLYGSEIGLRNEYAEIAHSRQEWSEAANRWTEILNDTKDKKRVAAAYVRATQAYCKLSKFDKAQKIIDEGLKIHPMHIHVRSADAQVAMERQDWPLAIEKWRTIIKDFGGKAPAGIWASLGTTLRLANMPDEAESVAREGLSKFPGDLEMRMVLAEISVDKRDWANAYDRWKSISDEIEGGSAVLRVKLYARLNASVLKRLSSIKEYKKTIEKYKKRKTRPKIAIYTSFTGDYDVLKLPEIIDERFDYIVYTDEKIDDLGVYKVFPLNQPGFNNDGSRASRYPKTHPHILLKGYDVAVWVDASIMVVGDLIPLIGEFVNSGLPVGNATHPHRQSLSEEFEACIDLRKDDPEVLRKQSDFYKSIGFDTRDLANNGVLFFNLKHKKLKPTMETWWDQICRFSKRDQLSFNYALFKNETDRFGLTRPPVDIRNHQLFVFVPHHSESKTLDALYSLL